ncbi:MAG: hypothetical protein H6581_14735 [Bacteroidia bacterium]|nr:hypothetical protein [Bacteroidia bacterium]
MKTIEKKLSHLGYFYLKEKDPLLSAHTGYSIEYLIISPFEIVAKNHDFPTILELKNRFDLFKKGDSYLLKKVSGQVPQFYEFRTEEDLFDFIKKEFPVQ